jgi:hypothetical protein
LTPAPSEAATGFDDGLQRATLHVQLRFRTVMRLSARASSDHAPAPRANRIRKPARNRDILEQHDLLRLVAGDVVEQQPRGKREHGETRGDDARAIANDDRNGTEHFDGDHERQQCARHATGRHIGLCPRISRDLAETRDQEDRRHQDAADEICCVAQVAHGCLRVALGIFHLSVRYKSA